MIQQNDKQCTRCMDIVEIVSKIKKQRALQIEQNQADEHFLDLLNAAFQSNNEEHSTNGDDIFNMFFGRRRGHPCGV